MLEEFTSKNLQNTLDKLMTDCDRRQSMVQELISSSQRIQSVFHVTLSIWRGLMLLLFQGHLCLKCIGSMLKLFETPSRHA